MTNAKDIMHTIVQRSLRALSAEQGMITLVDRDADDSMKTLLRTNVSSGEREQYHFNQNLLGWMHINKRPLMINDPLNDPRFRGVKWDESVESLVSVPLIVKSKLRGVLTVYNKKGGGSFTEEDNRLLAIIAAQSAQVVENARLYEAEQSLIRMKEELRLAAQIQTELLPKPPPALPGYDIAGKSVPAQAVGGDYFDFIRIDDSRLAICVGDVSGKGLPASLFMASVKSILKGAVLSRLGSLGSALAQAQEEVRRENPEALFVTAWAGVLDLDTGELEFTNAGHEPAWSHVPRAQAQRLEVCRRATAVRAGRVRLPVRAPRAGKR